MASDVEKASWFGLAIVVVILVILYLAGVFKSKFTNPTRMRQHQEFDLSS